MNSLYYLLIILEGFYVVSMGWITFDYDYEISRHIQIYYRSVFLTALIVSSYVYIYLRVRARHQLEASKISVDSFRRQGKEILLYFVFIWQFLLVDAYIIIFIYSVPINPQYQRAIYLQEILIELPSRFAVIFGLSLAVKRAVKERVLSHYVPMTEEPTRA